MAAFIQSNNLLYFIGGIPYSLYLDVQYYNRFLEQEFFFILIIIVQYLPWSGHIHLILQYSLLERSP